MSTMRLPCRSWIAARPSRQVGDDTQPLVVDLGGKRQKGRTQGLVLADEFTVDLGDVDHDNLTPPPIEVTLSCVPGRTRPRRMSAPTEMIPERSRSEP
jgi:hypothetical protein